MERLFIQHTTKSPKLDFDPVKGDLTISGRSILENPFLFYKPVFEWLRDFLEDNHREIMMIVQLEYFNSGTSKCLLEMFKLLEQAHGSKAAVNVKWFYEPDDESILEAGEDFQMITKIPVELVALEGEA